MLNWPISTARAVYYQATEPRQVRKARRSFDARITPFKPLISIVLPTFNRVGILFDRALPSVLRQTYGTFELLICAHGCTDDTVSRVKRMHDKRVRLIEVPRTETYPPTAENHWLAGPVVPITAGLDAARGHWIARIDDDDCWTLDHLEKLLTFAASGHYEFVSSAYQREVNHVLETVKHDGEEPPIGGVQTWLYRSYLKFMRPNPDCWRKAWNRVNDTDLAERFRKASVRIGFLDEVTAVILPRPGETEIGSKAYIGHSAEIERKYAFAPASNRNQHGVT